MKMSDYFELPLDEHATVELCDRIALNLDGNDQEIYAMMQALNLHDELVEMLEIFEEFCGDVQQENTALYGYAKRLESKIDELLKKARGEA